MFFYYYLQQGLSSKNTFLYNKFRNISLCNKSNYFVYFKRWYQLICCFNSIRLWLVRRKFVALILDFRFVLRGSAWAAHSRLVGLGAVHASCLHRRVVTTHTTQKVSESAQSCKGRQGVESPGFGEELSQGDGAGQRVGGATRGGGVGITGGCTASGIGRVLGLKVCFLQLNTGYGGKEVRSTLANGKYALMHFLVLLFFYLNPKFPLWKKTNTWFLALLKY